MNSQIGNYFEYSGNIAAGAQPTAVQLQWLKENKFDAIVNISPVSTRNYLKEESDIVDANQMIYTHFPVDCSNLQKHHYETFRGILNGLKEKKIFIHCGGNIKTSCLMHMYDVLERNMPEEESIKNLKKIQNPEAKWFPYFKSFGMIGLQ